MCFCVDLSALGQPLVQGGTCLKGRVAYDFPHRCPMAKGGCPSSGEWVGVCRTYFKKLTSFPENVYPVLGL